MNILPHKSWHVRTKKNIARVRKDEAEAAEKEKETQRRIQLAAQEARTSFLRDRASQRVEEVGEELPIPLAEVANLTQGDGHINFFQDLESGMKLNSEVNKEHEEEKKKEQEDYEKKIGYLVYLGQDSLEQKKDRPWYESQSVARTSGSKPPSGFNSSDPAQLKITKFKEFEDPLKDIRKFLSTPGVKKVANSGSTRTTKHKLEKTNTESIKDEKSRKSHKSKKRKSKKHKHKHSKRSKTKSRNTSESESSESDFEEEKKKRSLEKLRAERLEREREERRKAEKLLATLRGEVEEPVAVVDRVERLAPPLRQKYNSQFNPQLARQNYDN